jgi:DNA-binding LacI/PurR family transcriptional regulator
LRETRILALERFRKEPVFLTPRHHDLLHEAETKYRVLVHYKYVPTTENLRDILLSPPSGYHGILLHRPSQDWIDALMEHERVLRPAMPLPLLISGRSLAGSGYNYVSPDHFGQTRAAAAKLVAKGHVRVGYVSGLISQDYMRLAYRGYEKALQDAGLPLHPEDHLVLESLEAPDIEKTIQNFLAGRQFSGLVVAGSAFSAAFENAVQRAAIHIPAELSVVLVTEKIILDHLALRWTAHLYPDEVIFRAIEALAELSGNPQAGVIQELVPFPEMAGATCQAPSAQLIGADR